MYTLVKYTLKNHFRDFEAVFWTIIFPILFLFLFKFAGNVFNDVKLFPDFPKNLSYFDLVVPGIIGFGIAQSHTTSVAINLTTFKEKMILKRVAATPLPVWKFITGQILSHLIIAIFQISAILLISKLVLDSNLGLKLGGLTFFYGILGAIVFINIGLICGSITKTPKAANAIASTIVFTMLFSSGVFFSAGLLPKTLDKIAQYLPLTALVDLLRATAVGDLAFSNFWFEIVVLFTWIIITTLVVLKLLSFTERN